MIDIKKTTLSNKLRVLVMPMRSTEAVTVMILVRAGSRYETKSINGIAHFLEHMFFKGGERYPTPRSVAEAIDAIGGIFNAFTSDEYVGYFVKVEKDKIEIAFDVLSDMLLNAKFDAEGLERERGVITEEYNMYIDTPQFKIWDIFERLFFGDHPLGWSTIGLPEVIQKVKRQDFINYRGRLYTPTNIVVSVAGNTTTAKVASLVKKYLPYPKTGKKNQPLPYHAADPKKKFQVVYKKTEQAHLVIGVPTFGANHPDKYVGKVLASVLGGGMSSRLFTSVRERHGLAYYVSANSANYIDAGYLVASAGVDVKRIDLAVKTILDEFREITLAPIPAKELAKAKEYLTGGLVLAMEDSDEVACSFGIQELLHDKTETIDSVRKKIRRVTAAQVQKLAKQIFKDDRLCLTVIGPYRTTDKIKKAFKL
ncbi:MAG: pitrilysin family protein [Patescibacteria group bacterium]|jgi:predicted Zn-dependent peptidase